MCVLCCCVVFEGGLILWNCVRLYVCEYVWYVIGFVEFDIVMV